MKRKLGQGLKVQPTPPSPFKSEDGCGPWGLSWFNYNDPYVVWHYWLYAERGGGWSLYHYAVINGQEDIGILIRLQVDSQEEASEALVQLANKDSECPLPNVELIYDLSKAPKLGPTSL